MNQHQRKDADTMIIRIKNAIIRRFEHGDTIEELAEFVHSEIGCGIPFAKICVVYEIRQALKRFHDRSKLR